MQFRTDVQCSCVGQHGPNPECGGCAGSGCVGRNCYDSDVEKEKFEELEKSRRFFRENPL